MNQDPLELTPEEERLLTKYRSPAKSSASQKRLRKSALKVTSPVSKPSYMKNTYNQKLRKYIANNQLQEMSVTSSFMEAQRSTYSRGSGRPASASQFSPGKSSIQSSSGSRSYDTRKLMRIVGAFAKENKDMANALKKCGVWYLVEDEL